MVMLNFGVVQGGKFFTGALAGNFLPWLLGPLDILTVTGWCSGYSQYINWRPSDLMIARWAYLSLII